MNATRNSKTTKVIKTSRLSYKNMWHWTTEKVLNGYWVLQIFASQHSLWRCYSERSGIRTHQDILSTETLKSMIDDHDLSYSRWNKFSENDKYFLISTKCLFKSVVFLFISNGSLTSSLFTRTHIYKCNKRNMIQNSLHNDGYN